jgi:hypothetical protein
VLVRLAALLCRDHPTPQGQDTVTSEVTEMTTLDAQIPQVAQS